MNLIQIENKTGTVKLDGTVTETSMDVLIDRMATLYGDDAVRNQLMVGDAVAVAQDSLQELEIQINSPGGSVYQGYRAYKTIMELRNRGVHVTARITKLAASMGSIISAAADKVIMEQDAKMMIHDASTISWGTAEELRKTANTLDGISGELAGIYAAKTGKPLSEMRTLMVKETWLNAEDAVSLKLADEIYQKDPAMEKPKTRLDKLLTGEVDSKFDIRTAEPTKKEMSLLSKLFPGNDQVAQLEAQVAEIDSLQTELATAQAKVQELTGLSAIIADKDTEITALADEKVKLSNEITTLTTALADKDKEIETAKASAAGIATQTLAAIGQPEPIQEAEAPVAIDHMKVLNSLTGADRRNYWKTHRAALRATL
jgi:ATP-dependent protease ClpP protease subunit